MAGKALKPTLEEARPDLVAQIHPEDREWAQGLTLGSNKKPRWICLQGHEWIATVYNRVKNNSDCRQCSVRKRGAIPLSSRPDLLQQVHPEDREWAQELTLGSNKKCRWVCEKGHESIAVIYGRVNGRGCAYCSNQRVNDSNSLKTTHPDLYQEIHADDQNLAENITAGSEKQLRWICSHGHNWIATVNNRTRENGNGCPYCSHRKIDDSNCLLATHPQLCKELDPGSYERAKELAAGSQEKLKWICPRHGSFESRVVGRTNGSKCPYCQGRKIHIEDCAATTHPYLLKYIHMEDIQKLYSATHKSKIKMRFICPSGHERAFALNTFIDKTVDKGEYQCSSFAAQFPQYISLLSEGDIRAVSQCANNKLSGKFLYHCNNGHQYYSTLARIVTSKGKCQKCAILEKASAETSDLVEVKKIDSGDKEYQYILHANNKLEWQCVLNPNHKWLATFQQYLKNQFCPYCTYRLTNETNCFKTTHPEISKEIYSEDAHIITKNNQLSKRKVRWLCPSGHIWYASINGRVSGETCRKCKRIEQGDFIPAAVSHPDRVKYVDPIDQHLLNVYTANSKKKIKVFCEEGHEKIISIAQLFTCKKYSCQECSLLVTKYPHLLPSIHPGDRHLAYKFSANDSRRKVRWICDRGHEWKTTFRHITHTKSWCPYCAGKKVLPETCLASTHPELAKELRVDNAERAYNTMAGTQQKLWWVCAKGHQWHAAVLNRVNGRNCPYCFASSWTLNQLCCWLEQSQHLWVGKSQTTKRKHFKEIGILNCLNNVRHLAELMLANELSDEEVLLFIAGNHSQDTQDKYDAFVKGQYGSRCRAAVSKAMRRKVIEEKGDQCLACGTKEDIHMDHIIPFARGGKTEPENLQPLCGKHNRLKTGSTMTLEQLKQKIKEQLAD